MKQYRIKREGQLPQWSEWRNLNVQLKDHNILTVQFNEPLTVEESEEFFKHFKDVA